MLRSVTHIPLSDGTTQTTVPTGSAVPLTTATPVNVMSKSLTPGVYLVWGIVDFNFTNISAAVMTLGVSNISATLLSQAGGTTGGMTVGPDPNQLTQSPNLSETQTQVQLAGPTIVTVTATSTLYLVAELTFSGGSCTVNGTLNAMLISAP